MLTNNMWLTPLASAHHNYVQQERELQTKIDRLTELNTPTPSEEINPTKSPVSQNLSDQQSSNNKAFDDSVAMHDIAFDPDRILCCSVENGHTLVHLSLGRGYGLGSMGISSGCYQWKVTLHDLEPKLCPWNDIQTFFS